MKILYVTDTYLPETNGVVTSLNNLAKAMQTNGHEVHIIAPENQAHKTSKLPLVAKTTFIPSIQAPFYKDTRLSLPFDAKMLRAINDFKPDVVHAFSCLSLGWGVSMVAKMMSVPIVISFHTFFMEPEYLKKLGFKNNPTMIQNILWNLSISMLNSFDAIHTPARFSRGVLSERGLLQYVSVIPNIADTEQMIGASPDKLQSMNAKYGAENHKYLFVGRLEHEKSVDVLIKAFYHLTKRSKNSVLLLVGDGSQKQNLKKLITKYSIEDKVFFLGNMTQSELFESGLYEISTAFVTASTSEIQPISILEAMYYGLPIICTKSKGTGEILEHNGLGFEEGDYKKMAELMTLVQSVDKRLEESKKSKKAFEHVYGPKSTIEKYEQWYSKSIAKKESIDKRIDEFFQKKRIQRYGAKVKEILERDIFGDEW